MPRRSSGGRSAPRPAVRTPSSKTPQPAAHAPPPAPAPAHAPPPAPVQRSSGGGFGAAIVDGIGWGVGTSIAHRAVDAIMGPRVIQHETVASSAPVAQSAPTMNTVGGSDACSVQSKAFQECLNSYGSDISKCQFYMDMLSDCRKSSSSVLGA